jgi:Icc-related predicted phosphoesterase
MRIVVVSDTHGKHEELGVLSGDVLIHCGDVFNAFRRSPAEVAQLDTWFGRQRFSRILCIGGNHDFALQELAIRSDPPLRNAEYLQDRAFEYGSVRFYGSPWTPELSDWAYYLPSDELESRWASIPKETDVLVTHTPPFDILDRNSSGKLCGCPSLRKRIEQFRPRRACGRRSSSDRPRCLRRELIGSLEQALVSARPGAVYGRGAVTGAVWCTPVQALASQEL